MKARPTDMATTAGDEHRNGRRSNVRLAVVLAIVAVFFYFSIFVLTDS